MTDEKPDAFPVRVLSDGTAEVLLIPEDKWLSCEGEQEAKIIASAPVLNYERLVENRSGVEFAERLGEVSRALEAHHIGFGSRFFARRAEEARESGDT